MRGAVCLGYRVQVIFKILSIAAKTKLMKLNIKCMTRTSLKTVCAKYLAVILS